MSESFAPPVETRADRALRVLQETADTENLSLMAQAEHAMKTASLHMTRGFEAGEMSLEVRNMVGAVVTRASELLARADKLRPVGREASEKDHNERMRAEDLRHVLIPEVTVAMRAIKDFAESREGWREDHR